MSYILEGLKKLERNHQGVGTPVLLKTYKVAPMRPERRWGRYVALVSGILVLAGFAGAYGWYLSAKSNPAVQKPLESQPMTMEPERPPLEATEPPTKVGSRQPAPLAQPIVEKVENVIDAPKHDMPAKKTIRRHAEATRVEGGNANGEEAVNPAGLGEKAIPYHQLPDDVKKSLSEIKVFLHCYSPESQERFVQINDHTLHEGQSRPDGLKVLRITQHKAILSFQGHRFYLQAVEK